MDKWFANYIHMDTQMADIMSELDEVEDKLYDKNTKPEDLPALQKRYDELKLSRDKRSEELNSHKNNN